MTGRLLLTDLRAEAVRCRDDTDRPDRIGWVAAFERSVEQFCGNDAARHTPAWRQLENYPGKGLRQLHANLMACAERLKVQDLVARLRLVRKLAECDPAAAALPPMLEAFASVCATVGDLTIQHGWCQSVDDNLRDVAGVSATPKPEDVVFLDDVLANLDKLQAARPGDLVLADVVKAAALFAATGRGDAYTEMEMKFHEVFLQTDTRLLTLCGRLVNDYHRLERAL